MVLSNMIFECVARASLAAGCIALAGGIPETADLGAWDRPVQVRVLAAEAPDLAETVE